MFKASFGGILGLLLGFSFVTAFELIYFFTIRVFFDRLKANMNTVHSENWSTPFPNTAHEISYHFCVICNKYTYKRECISISAIIFGFFEHAICSVNIWWGNSQMSVFWVFDLECISVCLFSNELLSNKCPKIRTTCFYWFWTAIHICFKALWFVQVLNVLKYLSFCFVGME